MEMNIGNLTVVCIALPFISYFLVIAYLKYNTTITIHM